MDAQEHPENHTDLIVRVAGYSAYLVELSKGLQDSIIERAEQSFVQGEKTVCLPHPAPLSVGAGKGRQTHC